jgi:hypothetical protein
MNTKSLGVSVLATILLLVFGSIAWAQNVVRDREPIQFAGYLSCGTAEDGTRVCPFRLHYVELEKGRTYLIQMESTEFDAKLTLEDQRGNVLATDKDNYDALYGMIAFRPSETAHYRLIADCLTPMEGFYTITVRELPSILAAREELTTSASERSFEVELIAGRRYIIDMQSADFNAFIRLTNSEGGIVSFEDVCGAMKNARIVYEPTVTATYRVIAASGSERTTGTFRLWVNEK